MADGTFVSASMDPNTGTVHLLRNVNGQRWRRAVSRHSAADLSAFAPDMPEEQRAGILAAWEAMPPVEVPE